MAFEHVSGLPDAHERPLPGSSRQGLVFMAHHFAQAADFNEAFRISRDRTTRIGRLIARDGNRIEGAAAIVQRDLGNVILTAGKLFVQGDILDVPQAVLSGIAMEGRVEIGVRIARSWITADDDPTLLGVAPGTLAEGEPGAAREHVALAWSLSDDGGAGEFVPVYSLLNGTVIDQNPPPALDGVTQAISTYDMDSHGHYVVRGCEVTALGREGTRQVFSVSEGTANIEGYKRTRFTALRFSEPEEFSTETVDGEAHVFGAGGTTTLRLGFSPVVAITLALVTKETTETVTRGGVTDGADLLSKSSVTSVLTVSQGATTFAPGSDYIASGTSILWTPGGAEPTPGSTYSVTYRYLDNVSPVDVGVDSVTLGGGVPGSTVIVGYTWAVPRVDRICLDSDGYPVYVRGIPARQNPMPPPTPADLLSLCQVHNNWIGAPTINARDTASSVTFKRLNEALRQLEDHGRLIALERMQAAINSREPIVKLGLFVDPLTDDTYRDNGVAQTAAVGDGVIQLAIAPTFYNSTLTEPVMLNWIEEVVLDQPLATACEKINPYQNFLPLPGAISLTPAVDFWEERVTEWASDETREFLAGTAATARTATSSEIISLGSDSSKARFLRQIPVAFVIKGFGGGEILDALTFDNIDVKPGGLVAADTNGEITGTFTIPANVTAGTKEVNAKGAGGTTAKALFTGEGTITVDTLRRVTTISRWTAAATTTGVRTIMPDRSAANGQGNDPQGQTFGLSEARQLVGADFRICALGDPTNAILLNQTGVVAGFPTTEIRAEAFLPMTGFSLGWVSPRYRWPVLSSPNETHAIVIKTDDADHAVSVANVGDFDPVAQSYVAAQPYTTGVRVSSSNAETWTAHQDSDLTMRIVAAYYPDVTKTVPLGSFNLVDCSDLKILAGVEIPSADCSVIFELRRADGRLFRLQANQVLSFTEYVTETVTLSAVLAGTHTLSPTLFAPVTLVAGKLAAAGTYVTRALKMGADITLKAYVETRLPVGSTLAVEYDLMDENWMPVPLDLTTPLQQAGWNEQKFIASHITAPEGRLRLTLTGTPAARPVLCAPSAHTTGA